MNVIMEHWDFLQVQCAMYINSDLPGLPMAYQSTSKPLRCATGPPCRPPHPTMPFAGAAYAEEDHVRQVMSPGGPHRADGPGMPLGHVLGLCAYSSTHPMARFRGEAAEGWWRRRAGALCSG